MALYTDIEPVVKRLTAVVVTDDAIGIGKQMGVNLALEILAKAPLVEAEPVVHAHWVEDDHGCCRNCSVCGFRVGDDTSYDLYGDWKIAPKRCPECGAHMDEEVNNE